MERVSPEHQATAREAIEALLEKYRRRLAAVRAGKAAALAQNHKTAKA